MEEIYSPIKSLPEDCVSHVISLTSPRVASISAAASPIFKSAADSDTTWQNFLPSDYASVLSRCVNPVEYSSKKDLFFRLCQSHVLIDGGKMSFGLERSSGAKCFMISARAMVIVWSDSPKYWRWISLPDSRFEEVAELIEVCWLEIHGRINSKSLSPNMTYSAYLVYKLSETSDGLGCPIGTISQQASVTLGKQMCRNTVCLQKFYNINPITRLRRFRKWQLISSVGNAEREMINNGCDARMPKERRDGWTEIEMGEFYIENGEDGDVEISLMETKGHWKSGIIIQGIEIRPKFTRV